MERAKLKGFGLTDEQIDEIMNDHGAVVNAAKSGKEALEQENERLSAELAEKADYSALKEEVESLRAGNQELVDLRAYKEDREYGDRFTSAVGDRAFVNDVTRDHVRSGFVAAAKDPSNEGKTDTDLLTAVVGDKEAEYYKSKVSIFMTPSMPTTHKDDGGGKVKMVPYNP